MSIVIAQWVIILGLITWGLLVFSGLLIITIKLFNKNNLQMSCPDVDMNTKTNINGINYVLLKSDKGQNINKNVILLDNPNLGIARMSMIVFWIGIIPMFVYLLVK